MLLAFFPIDSFVLNSGEDQIRGYTFNKHIIQHQFCQTCGTEAFAYGKGPDGAAMCAVNLRCVPELALDSLKIHPFDGASA
jgi:hypothetical protein